ncbi:alcohol dehydrogenase catalytic domain-containing protein [Vulcanisaeta souniana]|nr:alcohol dehydrogenase catalytic domain-containing protein [Vulcanisaeta souniana]
MRVLAAVLREFNKPFNIEEFDIGDPSPNDVVVRVRAEGICGRDLVIWKGGFRNLKPP